MLSLIPQVLMEFVEHIYVIGDYWRGTVTSFGTIYNVKVV